MSVRREARPSIARRFGRVVRCPYDGLIDPRDSRAVLAMTLSIARDSERRSLNPNTFGIARM